MVLTLVLALVLTLVLALRLALVLPLGLALVLALCLPLVLALDVLAGRRGATGGRGGGRFDRGGVVSSAPGWSWRSNSVAVVPLRAALVNWAQICAG